MPASWVLVCPVGWFLGSVMPAFWVGPSPLLSTLGCAAGVFPSGRAFSVFSVLGWVPVCPVCTPVFSVSPAPVPTVGAFCGPLGSAMPASWGLVCPVG